MNSSAVAGSNMATWPHSHHPRSNETGACADARQAPLAPFAGQLLLNDYHPVCILPPFFLAASRNCLTLRLLALSAPADSLAIHSAGVSTGVSTLLIHLCLMSEGSNLYSSPMFMNRCAFSFLATGSGVDSEVERFRPPTFIMPLNC